MGQRSQIYIRIWDKENKPTLYAKYFQWNYGERMISRAKYGIEYIKDSIEYLGIKSVQEKINKIFDINFDMKDVALTCDIIKEWAEQFPNEDFNTMVFEQQDNNDGKLFVDVHENGEIKYCLTDYDFKILPPNTYMDWEDENWEVSKYVDVETCKKNIEYINENAKLMTDKELQEFIHYNYIEQANKIWAEYNAPKF